MNLFHKIVWNTARQQYVVTSELTRGRSKSATTCSARATATLSETVRGLATAMAVLPCALVLAGFLTPGSALASTCASGTAGASAPVGGACTVPDYHTATNQNGVGSAIVTNGGTVTLKGAPNYDSGFAGNTDVQAGSVTVVNGSFENASLSAGPQNVPVAGPNSATGTNIVYQTYNSGAFTDVSNANAAIPQFNNVNGDQYINESLGRVAKSGGTLNVNLGATPTGAPSSNSIFMVSKQSYLTSADGSGSANSKVVWNSRNQINMGIDPGLNMPDPVTGYLTAEVPVTTYAGTVNFQGVDYQVNNALQLAAYNDVLVAALQSGALTSQSAYNDAIAQAYSTTVTAVTYKSNTTAGDLTRVPTGDRYAILADGKRGSAVISQGGQIDITQASGAVKGTNGATVTNNGRLSGNVIQQVVDVQSGAHFINGATGVVSSGYLIGNNLNTATDPTYYYTGSGVVASGANTTVQNSGIINAAGFDHPDNTWLGLGLADGATGTNSGNINVGVNPGFVSSVVGVNVSGGSSFTNAAGGNIYIGRAAQYALSDPTTDVAISGRTYGIRVMDTGDSAINNGHITIGSLTQNAIGMYSTGPINSTLINAGTIDINGAASGMPLTNIGMMADDNGSSTNAIVRNAGVINLNGVNGVGVLVNADPGLFANAESTGTINVKGDTDPASGTRNFGMWVDGAGAVGNVSGAVNLSGVGAIGVFAQNGGTVNVASASVPQFLAGTDQIGFYASGAGSTINVNASALTVNTDRSTMFRVADGATYNGSSSAGPINLTVSGTDARGVVGTGMGTTVSTGSSVYNVTGAAGTQGGAAAIVNEGGSSATIDAATTINLANAGATAGIVDGQAHDLSGAAIGAPIDTTLTNNALIQSSTGGAIGFVARNQGTLINNNVVSLSGPASIGVVVGPQGIVNNMSTIHVANGDGALVQGSGSTLNNNGTISADDGTAAVHLTGPGASVAFSGNGLIDAGGTADGILIDPTAVGGRITGTAGTIVVNGSGLALDNKAAGATIDLTNTAVTTSGTGAYGISSTGANGNIAVTGGNITTSGANAVGIYVGSAGTLTMSNATISTNGNQAHGVLIDSGATGSVTGGSITASGANSSALYVQGPSGAIQVNGTTLTSNAGAGATAHAGGTLGLTGATLNGATHGIAITDGASGNLSAVTVTGGSVAGLGGNAIDVDGSRADITVRGGAALAASTGTLLNVTNGSTVNFNAIGETLTGDLLADASSTATANLQNSTILTGRVDPMSLNIDATSTWNVTANSTLTSLSNAGLIAFVPPTGNPAQAGGYKTVTATNYAGNNGTIALNTFLAGDNAPSDKLVINGGTASGTTGLRIVNTGGPGALTTADGINVVAVANGGTTGANAFRLTAPVQSGAYQYLLYRGGSTGADDYFLRSALADPGTPSQPGGPSAPVAYRPGVVGYALTPALNMDYGFANLGRLQERVGDIASTERVQKGNQGGVWGRIGFQTLDVNSGSRFSASQQTYFMQFGKDWTLTQLPDGGSTHAGVTASLGVASAKFQDSDRDLNSTLSNKTGTSTMQAQSLGGYYTKYLKDGSYWDSVAQVTHYGNKYSDVYGGSATQNGMGLALSQEVGKPFALSDRVSIEPQAQLVYQYLNLDSFNDGVSHISGNSSSAVRGRLGVRLFMPNIDTPNKGGAGTPYLTFDVLHDFLPQRRVVVDGTSFSPDMGRTWGEAGIGISAAVGKSGQFYASTKYAKNIGGEDRRQTFVQVGYRYSW